ncbi:unnamed protein product [Closterium sp. NIES-53]
MAQFLVPEQQRSGKLQPKARWGLHLGVSERIKGWELLDIADNRVVTMSDVVFYGNMSLDVWKSEHGPASGRKPTIRPTDTSTVTLPLLAEADELAAEDVEDVPSPFPSPASRAPPLITNLRGLTLVSASGDEGRSGASPSMPPEEEQAEEVQPTVVKSAKGAGTRQQLTGEQVAAKPTKKQLATGQSAGEPTSGEQTAGTPTVVQQDAEGSDDSDDGGEAEESVDSNLPELDLDMHANPEHRWDISTMMVKEALASWKGVAVKAAMEEEIHSLIGMGTWELVERPPGVNIMKNRWVLTMKYHIDDTVEREKARVVVKGFTQVYGTNYDETYAPVSSYVTLTIFLSIVAVLDLNLIQLDMKNAFLQSKLDRVLYMHQPDYFNDGTGRVCKLMKSLYGLKQSPLLWYMALDGVLLGAGWKKSQVDTALYFKFGDDKVICWVLVYVDDLLAAKSSTEMLKELKELLEATFELREISLVRKYLGLEMVRDRSARKLWLHQQGYADKLRRPFLDKEQTGPDIAFACSKLGSGLTVRSDPHSREVDRCLAYLANTRDTTLEFGGGADSLKLVGYVDADNAGDKQNRTSTGGYVFVFGGAAVSRSSQRIKCATLSSTKSEYVAATNAGKEGRRLCFLLAESRQLDAGTPTVLRVDNKLAITVAKGMGLTGNLKHMERRQAWLQHMVKRGKFSLRYIPTTEQPANFLTKALHYPAFNRCSVAIGQRERGRGVSTGVVVGPVLAWAELTSGSGVRSAADLFQWASWSMGLVDLHKGHYKGADFGRAPTLVGRLGGSTSGGGRPVEGVDFGDADQGKPAGCGWLTGVLVDQSYLRKAITGEYSSQWQTAMDAEMASWKSTGTYVDEVPPPEAGFQGSLHEEIWLRRPPGFTGSFPKGTQWSLRQPVYGLRQAPHEWHDTLRRTLAALGFPPSTADSSLFQRTDHSLPPFYILVYVDDLVFATVDTEALTLVKAELQKRHTCTDLGPSVLRLLVLLATVHSSTYRPLALSSIFRRVPQQLREWYAGRGRSGGVGPCTYVLRTGGHRGKTCGLPHTALRCFGRLTDAWRAQFPDAVELPRWGDLLKHNVAIFDLDFDAILAAMYAVTDSAEVDCYLSVRPDPGIEAAALGASASAAPSTSESAAPGAGEPALSSTAPTEALHAFTLDSGASRSFFRDGTTLTPLSQLVAISLADPSGGPVLAHSSTVLPCPADPSGLLSGLHLPSFSTNLVSGADLQDAWVDPFTPGGQRVTHCTCSRTGRHLATFTRRPGSSLYTLTTASPPVVASGWVAASGQVFSAASRSSPESAPCSCHPLSHETLLWHHRLGHPSLPRLRARVRGQGHEHYFLLGVDDYSRYTTVFPLHSKDRGGEFSSDLLRAFCRMEGICQTFTLPASPQQNGIAERRIGMGSRAFVRDTSADKLSSRAVPCVFLGFPPDAPRWQFYHPTSRRVLSSQDVTFDEWYAAHQINLQPRVSLPETTPTLRWTGKVGDVLRSVSGAARGAEVAGVGTGGAELGGAEPECVEPGVAEPERVEPGGAEFERVGPGVAKPGGAESGSAEPARAESGGPPGASGAAGGAAGAGAAGGAAGAGAAGAAGPGGAGAGGTGALGGPAGVEDAGGAGAAGPGGARTGGTGAAGAGGAATVGAGAASTQDAAGAGPVEGPGAGGTVGVVAVDPGAEGTGAVCASPSQLQPASPLPGPSPYSGPTSGLMERCEPESRPVSPESRPTSRESRSVHAGRRVSCPRPPPVPGPHSMTLRPSTAPQRVPLPSPPASSLPDGPEPESDSLRAASPTVTRFLATVVTDPLFLSTAASALVAELVDFAAACRLDYATSLVAESECASVCPSSVRDIPTPRSYAEAIEGPYSSQWLTWSPRWLPGSPQAPTVKRPPGSPPVFKARYVARGFSQRQGVDFFQTFSPTPKMTTLRVLLHIASQRDYELLSLDFSTAFLQGSLHEEIWLRRPPGFTGTTLAALGFAPSTSDPSLFLRTDTTLPPFYVLVYVDDLVFATADTEALAHVKSELRKRHTCTDLGELTSYLGLRITRDRAQCTITLTQSHMVHQVLQHFGFTYCSPLSTPLPTGQMLSAPPSDESVEPSGPYPELVGCLMCLMTCTLPDLAYPLSLLARYVAPCRHRKVHWDAAKRVFRYLCSTLSSGSASWRSTSSSSVLSSSCEAEIYVGAMATQELRWLTYLLTDLGEAPRSPPVLYVDNKAMLALCQEHRLEHRTKHIALRYFLARELQQRGQLRLAYVASQANTADVFTKALQPCDHQPCFTFLDWPCDPLTKYIALRYFLAWDLQQRGQLRLAYVASWAKTADVFTKALGFGDHQHFCTALGLVPTLPHMLVS